MKAAIYMRVGREEQLKDYKTLQKEKAIKIMKYIRWATKFSDISLALSYAKRCKKTSLAVLGDDGMIWILPMLQAFALVDAGYELAE